VRVDPKSKETKKQEKSRILGEEEVKIKRRIK